MTAAHTYESPYQSSPYLGNVQVVEGILVGLHVQWLVVPSVKSLVGMWTCKFGFLNLSLLECEALEDRIVTPDTSSATMLKKKVCR